MDEAQRTQFKEFSDANRAAWAKAKALVRRKDRPANFAAWTPALNDIFDQNPSEAEYAIYLWELEAESRAYDLEPVLEPLYFTDLSRTLTCYADHLGLNTTNSLLEFAQWTSTGQNRELRAPFDDDGVSLIIDSTNDLIRLKAAISAKRHVPAISEESAYPSLSELLPKPSEIESQIISVVRKMDAERNTGGDPNSTGEQLARDLDRPFNATFKQALASMKRSLYLNSLPNRGYTLGPLAQWFCPDKEA